MQTPTRVPRALGAGLSLTLIAAVGFQLRSVIIAVPPALPQLRSDLHLSYFATGALTSIPIACFGLMAIPGALLVRRFGGARVVAAGALVLGIAALLRLAPPEPFTLFAFTGVLSLAIAVSHPALSALVHAWFPGRIQQASTVYALATTLGALTGSTLSVPLLRLAGWQGTFALWALLALAAAAPWLLVALRTPAPAAPPSAPGYSFAGLLRKGWLWRIAALFGFQSIAFYSSATWVPFAVKPYGPGFLALTLFMLNACTLPVGAVLAAIRRPWAESRLFYAGASVLMLAGALGFATGHAELGWLWALLVGTAIGMVYSGGTALPTLFARSGAEAASYTAVMLTLAYALAFVGPLLGGLLLDLTGQVTAPFLVIAAAAFLLLLLGATLPRRELAHGS